MSFSTTFINQPNYFGTQMADPRFAGQTTFSWTVNVNTTMPFMTSAEDFFVVFSGDGDRVVRVFTTPY
jgi:hypothetical protein